MERIKAPIATETMYEPQSYLDKKDNTNILKDHFSSRKDPSSFTYLIDQMILHEFSQGTSHFPPQSEESHSEILLKLRRKLYLLPQSRARTHFKQRIILSVYISISQKNIREITDVKYEIRRVNDGFLRYTSINKVLLRRLPIQIR